MYATATIYGDSEHGLVEVNFDPEPLDRFGQVLSAEAYQRLLDTAETARQLFAGRTVWNVTSTAKGGGVAEMLTSLLPLVLGTGVRTRWLVIRASEDFFRLTKRIHNRLQGDAGDGGELGPGQRALYEGALRAPGAGLHSLVKPNDVVILHDPQTAGLAPLLQRAVATLVWRCHIGVDVPNIMVHSAWDFLAPYLRAASAGVFSRATYVDERVPLDKVAIIPPSIDIFSPKNQSLTKAQTAGILASSGLCEGSGSNNTFVRIDGSTGVVTRSVHRYGGGRVPGDVRLVTQISRWDRLKDAAGVMRGFIEFVLNPDVHLVLAGPEVGSVADDPEGESVLRHLRALWSDLPDEARRRVHLVTLPMADIEENAAIVNALQRRADIVVQKSLAEGFGLTVAEAMWKERPIVASRVGGIQDQLVDGVSGLLVDPTDLAAFGHALARILTHDRLAKRLGREAHLRCEQEYLAPRHLARYVELFASLLSS